MERAARDLARFDVTEEAAGDYAMSRLDGAGSGISD